MACSKLKTDKSFPDYDNNGSRDECPGHRTMKKEDLYILLPRQPPVGKKIFR